MRIWTSIIELNNFIDNMVQVGNYIQPLWETIEPVNPGGQVNIYNGAVEAATTLTGKTVSKRNIWRSFNVTNLRRPTRYLVR